MTGRRIRLVTIAVLAVGVLLATTAPASADHHVVKIREVSLGADGTGGSDAFLELQTYDAGQNVMAGHTVKVFNPDGTVTETYTISAPIAPTSPESQRTVLLSDTLATRDHSLTGGVTAFETFLETTAPDFGAICFITTVDPANTTDCVSWGGAGFTGNAMLPSSAGTPNAGNLAGNNALRRIITGGSCATALDAGDDTNNSNADFADVTPQAPTPNSAGPQGTACTPPVVTTPPGNPASPINPAGNVRKRKCKKTKGAAAAKKKCKKKK